MRDAFLSVCEFEKAAGHELSNRKPQVPDMKTAELRFKLIAEESKETLDALTEIMLDMAENEPVRNDKLAEFADGLADLIWVAIGSAIHFGIDLPAVFQEVDRTNMAKFSEGAWVREDGKRMKPKNWTPPDIEGIFASQRPLAEIYGDQEEMAKWAAFVLSGYQFSNIARWEALFRAGAAEWMVRGYEGGGAYRTLDVADACREARKLDVKTEAR